MTLIISRILIINLVLTLLISSLAFGLESYNETGSIDQQFLLGTGIFNSLLTTDVTVSKSLTDGQNIPMVADLDRDGVNEIIVLDNGDIRLFQSSSLTPIDSITLELGTYSNMQILNFDNDTFLEIIIANEIGGDGNISILQYNGTSFIREYSLNVDLPTITGTQEVMIKCGDGQAGSESTVCLYALVNSPTGVGRRNLSVRGFNLTDIQPSVRLLDTGSTLEDYCFPVIPYITYANYDTNDDARKEFIFTSMEFKQSANEEINIFYIDVLENLSTILEQQIVESEGIINSAVNCEADNLGRFYTSPLVIEMDGSTSNGKETIIGWNVNENEFEMRSYKASGSDLDDYPEVFNADGQIISNVMVFDVFGGTAVDFCVLGQDATDQQLDLLCASEQTGIFQRETVEFKFNTDGKFNVTQAYNRQNIISHATQHTNTQVNIDGEGLINTNELLTPYGTFLLSDTTFNGSIFIKTLTELWENPVGDSACIQVDAEKVGSEDVICLQSSQVFYIDDTLANKKPTIGVITMNPCGFDSTIKINSTVSLSFAVTDQNPQPLAQDLVTSEVIFYEGNTNQHPISVVANTTSGQNHIHTFTANLTGNNFRVKITAFDNQEPTQTDVFEGVFSVGTSGVEFGECESIVNKPTTELNASQLLQTDANDNSILSGLNTFQELFGLGGTTLWYILMIILAYAIWITGHTANHSTTFGIIAITEILMLILGAALGIVGAGIIILIVTVSLIFIGLWVGKTVTGTNS